MPSGSDITVRRKGHKDEKVLASVVGMGNVKESHRAPILKNDNDSDVATMVCIEISRAIMIRPDVDLGVFTRTAANSRRDLTCSDATILITCAILEHIGNNKMANKILSRSATITKYYDKLGLNSKEMRELWVTVLFSLNPNFVKLIETSITIALDQSSKLNRNDSDDTQVITALVNARNEGLALDSEILLGANSLSRSGRDGPSRRRRSSIQTTPTEMISPSDSASVYSTDTRSRVTEGDLMRFVNRRKSGVEPSFKDVFRSSKPPMTPSYDGQRSAIGSSRVASLSNDLLAGMNRILGSRTVASANQDSGSISYRRPRVEDFLDSEELSGSVIEEIPDMSSNIGQPTLPRTLKGLAPTESYLPSSVITSLTKTESTIRPMDSYELLMASLDELEI
jgi:hypothetical protein